MANIVQKCPYCGQIARAESYSEMGGVKFVTFDCTHTVAVDMLTSVENVDTILDVHGYPLFPFQKENIDLIRRSSGRCIVGDQMGLGKTVTGIAALRLYPEMLPCLVFCKATTRMQWQRMFLEWSDYLPQIITSSRDYVIPQARIWIVSLDMLRRLNGMFDNIDYKTVIIDECHMIKNREAKRTKEVREICRKAQHVLPMSGTVFKNHEEEMFSVLNMTRPDKFPRHTEFISDWFHCYGNGTGSGYSKTALKNPREFRDYISDMFIRHTRAEVMPQMPPVQRQFLYTDLEDTVKEAYKEAMTEFVEWYEENCSQGEQFTFRQHQDIMAKMVKLKHLTGVAKVDFVIDKICEFLETTDEKIVVFFHHELVQKLLFAKLSCMPEINFPIMSLTSDIPPDKRTAVVERFRDSDSRILLASQLVAGESVDQMQNCTGTILMAERQWNAANEEQCEFRIARIGQTRMKLLAMYAIALGTIDEHFTKLVENKRLRFQITMNGEVPDAATWEDSEGSLAAELAKIIVAEHRKQWSVLD